MRLYFKKLIIENFLSFGHSELDLTQQGYVTIHGKNNNIDDFAQSNGSGKSSIFDALMWCLTGDTVRGNIKNICNILVNDGCYVKLILDVDGKECQILRSKDHSEYKSNLSIIVNGEDKSGKGIRDSQKTLEDLFPDLTSQLLGSVVILGQGLPQRFTNNTPSGRKEILEKLSKSDFMIEDIKNRAAEYKKSLSDSIRQKEDGLIALKTQVESNNNQIKSFYDKIEELDNIHSNTNLEKLQRSFDNASTSYSKIQELLDSKKCTIEDLNKKYNDALISKTLQVEEINNKYCDIVNNLKTLIIELNLEIKQKKEKLFEIKNIRDICPTCGQRIPNITKPDTADIENSIANLTVKLNGAEEDLDLKIKEKENELNAAENNFSSSINCLNCEIGQINSEIDSYSNNLLSLKKEIEDLGNQLSEQRSLLSTYMNLKSTYESNISKAQKENVKFNEEILYINKELDILNNKLQILNKIITLVNRDFRGYLLTDVISYINCKAKEYSNEIFNTTKIDVKLNGNNLDISYCDKSYESLSGGEKQKIDIIIQFSLRDMLCKYLNFESNILVIDECFDNLDQSGCQQIINLITNKLNVEAIYIITHHTDIAIPYDKEIFVVKGKDGISEIL